MQRTNVVELTPTPKQRRILQEMMLLSSCVYNMANYEARQAFFRDEKAPSFHDLQQRIQTRDDYQLLGRSYALPRLQIYAETQGARFRLIKSKTQEHVGLPRYLKNRKTNTTLPSFLTMDGCQYKLGARTATIPLSRQLREKHGLAAFRIPYNGVLRWHGEQQRGQIRLRGKKFYLYQSVEVADPRPVAGEVCAGIDLGEKVRIAAVTSNGEERILKSRRWFKQWEHFNSLIADEQARLAAIGRRSSRKLRRLYENRTSFQNTLDNNLVAKLFRTFKRAGVSTVYLGDVTGIREDNDHGKGNRMLHNYWAFDKLSAKIRNKAEAEGITVVSTTEEYTSRNCPLCGEPNTPKDRLYLCRFCDYFEHRDVVGATNIMLKGMRSPLWQSAHQDETALSSEALT
jgi:putative transposase